MCFCSYFILFVLFLFPSTTPTPLTKAHTTIPISLPNQTPHPDPYQRLAHLASASIARAHHLKNAKNAPVSSAPLHPFSGGYALSLSFGTPPQTIPMIMDTGSSFSWFPCTERFACRNCSLSSTTFVPKRSSSAEILGCTNPKCGWVHKSFDPVSSCRGTQICPMYILLYGSGSTGGVAMLETLNLPPHQRVERFLVGCSLFSLNQPAGVAGLGRGVSSLTSQLGVRRFSYCLVPHKFENTPRRSLLYIDTQYDSNMTSEGFSYTPLLKNPDRARNLALSEYYYVGLRRITVGGKRVEISGQEFSPGSEGNGGTIVDSGSTFTYANREVYENVANAFLEQVREYQRGESLESLTGLRPCYDVTGRKSVRMPDMELGFEDGVEMRLPLENVFVGLSYGEKMAVCLAMVTGGGFFGPEMVNGPSVILGNFLMQSFRVEFDLRNERFGFKNESCS